MSPAFARKLVKQESYRVFRLSSCRDASARVVCIGWPPLTRNTPLVSAVQAQSSFSQPRLLMAVILHQGRIWRKNMKDAVFEDR